MRLILLTAVLCGCLSAETGYDAWLRYQPIREPAVLNQYRKLPATVVVLDSSAPVLSAQAEMFRAVSGMLGRTLRTPRRMVDEDMIVLGTFAETSRFQVAAPAENT